VYRLALDRFGEQGPRFLTAYMETGTTEGTAKAIGVSRQTVGEWFGKLREGLKFQGWTADLNT